MTLQQLKYIVAVNRYHSFLKAAEACNVTQPTLSAMVLKLENELGVKIFERKNRTVSLTIEGKKIIEQAEKTLKESDKITKVAKQNPDVMEASLSLSVSPTIAQYILPDFIKNYTRRYPKIKLMLKDMRMTNMISGLLDGTLDASIGIAGNERKGIIEIPLYHEPFVFYGTEYEMQKELTNDDEKRRFVFVMKEALNLRDSAFTLDNLKNVEHNMYESNSIDALIRMIDCIGGYTIIPKMHTKYLTARQHANVVEIEKEKGMERRVSLYVRSNEVNTWLTKSVLEVINHVIPQEYRLGWED